MYSKEYMNLRFRIADLRLSCLRMIWLCFIQLKTIDYPIILYDLEAFRINSYIRLISTRPFQRTYNGGIRKFTKDMKRCVY